MEAHLFTITDTNPGLMSSGVHASSSDFAPTSSKSMLLFQMIASPCIDDTVHTDLSFYCFPCQSEPVSYSLLPPLICFLPDFSRISTVYSPISATAALDVSTSSSSSSGVGVSTSGSAIGSNGRMSFTQAGPASPYSPTSSTASGETRSTAETRVIINL